MSSGEQSLHYDESGGIHGHFRNACNGIICRYRKGDYNYLTKVGVGLLLGFGCYKFYQRYDTTFFISDHVPKHTRVLLSLTGISVIFQEIATSANALNSKPPNPEETNVHSQPQSENSEVSTQQMTAKFEGSGYVPASTSVEHDSQQHETARTFHQPAPDPPPPISRSLLPRVEYPNYGPHAPNQASSRQVQPQYQPTSQNSGYQLRQGNMSPPAQHGPQPSIQMGIRANNVGNFKVIRESGTTNIKAPSGANVRVGDELQDVTTAEVRETNCKTTIKTTPT